MRYDSKMCHLLPVIVCVFKIIVFYSYPFAIKFYCSMISLYFCAGLFPENIHASLEKSNWRLLLDVWVLGAGTFEKGIHVLLEQSSLSLLIAVWILGAGLFPESIYVSPGQSSFRLLIAV